LRSNRHPSRFQVTVRSSPRKDQHRSCSSFVNQVCRMVLPPCEWNLPDFDRAEGRKLPGQVRNRYGNRRKSGHDTSLGVNHLRNRKPTERLVGSFLGVVNLSYSERVWADWRRGVESVRPPLPFARRRRTEISRVGDELISTNVAQRKIDSGRHRGATESAALAGRT
jgi:hypothetical protein